MQWDGQAYANIVKERLYEFIRKGDIAKASEMSNIDYASYLHQNYKYAGSYCAGKPDIQGKSNGIEITFQDRLLNNDGEKTLKLSWSMTARHIRAWEYEATEIVKEKAPVVPPEKPKSIQQQKWDDTHLCGEVHGQHCEFLLATERDTVYNGKKLENYCVYCTRNNKCFKISSQATWTGLTPRNCRKRLEATHTTRKRENAEKTEEQNKMDTQKTVASFDFAAFTSQNNQLKMIPLEMLVYNDEYDRYDGERREEMVESIRKNGILQPLIVRAMADGTYNILVGNNRRYCGELAGLQMFPCIVKERLTDEEAQIYVDETNIRQRGFQTLRITKQAEVIARRHSEMFDKSKLAAIQRELALMDGEDVPDEVTHEAPEGKKTSKLAQVGSEYELSKDTVARLIRVNELVDELKPLVDDGRIALRAAVNLSYLFHSEQLKVAKMLVQEGCTVDMKKSATLKEISVQKQLNDKMIEAILLGQYNPTVKVKPKAIKVKISAEMSARYFAPDWDEAKIQEIVGLALEKYFNNMSFDDFK